MAFYRQQIGQGPRPGRVSSAAETLLSVGLFHGSSVEVVAEGYPSKRDTHTRRRFSGRMLSESSSTVGFHLRMAAGQQAGRWTKTISDERVHEHACTLS